MALLDAPPIQALRPNNTFQLTGTNFAKARQAWGKARNGEAVFRINCVGDSTTYGQGSTSAATSSWPTRLRGMLTTRTGLPTGLGAALPGVGTIELPITLGSGWANSAVGFANSAAVASSNTSAVLTIGPWTCTGFNIFYIKQGSGSYTLDGGTATTITTDGTGNVGTTTVTAAAGSHTLTISPVSGTFYVLAVEPLYANGTVAVANLGRSGSTATQWAQNTNNYDSIKCLQARTADLTLVTLGINDAGSNTVAAYQTALTTLVTTAKASGSVVIVVPPPPTSTSFPWAPYVAAMYQVAATQSVSLFDITARWVDHATSSVLKFDNFHPNDYGYWDMASFINSSLATVL